jgi:hypothetical protein
MAAKQHPSESEFNNFIAGLRQYRESLGSTDQALLDSMITAAMGHHEKEEEEVQSYWVAAGPRGVAVGTPYGGYVASPWGAAYGVRVW